MFKSYSIADARSNLPSIVHQAEAGVEVEITRRGRAVAVMVSPGQLERLRGERPRFSDAYRVFLNRHSLREVGIKGDAFRSVRGKSAGRKVLL